MGQIAATNLRKKNVCGRGRRRREKKKIMGTSYGSGVFRAFPWRRSGALVNETNASGRALSTLRRGGWRGEGACLGGMGVRIYPSVRDSWRINLSIIQIPLEWIIVSCVMMPGCGDLRVNVRMEVEYFFVNILLETCILCKQQTNSYHNNIMLNISLKVKNNFRFSLYR